MLSVARCVLRAAKWSTSSSSRSSPPIVSSASMPVTIDVSSRLTTDMRSGVQMYENAASSVK